MDEAMRKTLTLLGLCWLLLSAACGEEAAQVAHEMICEELPGIGRYVRLDERVAQGAEPIGEEGLLSLKRKGVGTIIRVDKDEDGKAAGLARKHGFEFFEIPLTYKGVTPEQAQRIVEAVRSSEGRVYIHCKSGKHRSAAAAGVYRVAFCGWSGEQATAMMRELGCNPKYTGLYRDVGAYRARS